jgi:WD40 repeat protein
MEQLPEECLDLIASYLGIPCLARLGISSSRLRSFCFAARYWTDVDFSFTTKVTTNTIKKLSETATDLRILNIQNCKNVNLADLVPLVFKFKRLELIKHDKKHKLLDETVAINRLLNNAERLIKANFNQSDDEQRAQYDNAVRQARALLWDALFVVVANKHSNKIVLSNEVDFENINHPQETLDLIMKPLRETENLLQKPVKLWSNTMKWKTPIAGAAFVKDPHTQKIYLACGVSGEIVFWDVEMRSVFKVFNYLDSLQKITAKHAKKQREFSSVLLFKHADRVLLLGGTFSRAICWDYDTKKIVYEIATPSESKENYATRYYAYHWGITKNGEGFVQHNNGAFLFDLGTGKLSKLLTEPKIPRSHTPYSSNNNGLLLYYAKGKTESTVGIANTFTQEVIPVLKLPVIPGEKDDHSAKTMDWFDDRLIALQLGNEMVIYKRESSDHKYELLSTIALPERLFDLRFLSEEFILCNCRHVYNVRSGTLELSLAEGTRGSNIVYSPELKLIAIMQNLSVVALYNMETKQKIAQEINVSPVCAISKIDDGTILLHGSFSNDTNLSPGFNYAKVSIRGGKFELLETVEAPWNIFDVSSDGKYVLAQCDNHGDIEYIVFELETKQVIFKRKFVGEGESALWMVRPVGQFMPQHPDQVLLAHPTNGFNVFDVKNGQLVQNFSHPIYGITIGQMKISLDEKYVLYGAVADLHEQKVYGLSGHSNTEDSLAFNPVNPMQVVKAGYGLSVFILPDTEPALACSTRYLDGLVQILREVEEIASCKFSPDGKYLAVLERPSRGPWGLEILITLIRVFETTTFTLVSSFDTGGQARALFWLNNEHAIISLINGEIFSLKLVVKEYKKLFDYIVRPTAAK